MQKENSDSIFNACPIIFRGRHEGPKQNLMCFGFECADGWFDIIYGLSKKVEYIAQTMKSVGISEDELPMVSQVKEKFGTLRFYIHHSTEEIQELINQAEQVSAKVCEQCGKPGTLKRDHGWFITICLQCEVKNEN